MKKWNQNQTYVLRVLSIGLALDKGNSLNNLKATICNHLKKAKEHYYKNKLDKNMLHLPDVKPMPKFEAFWICDKGVIIAASSTAHKILEKVTSFDG